MVDQIRSNQLRSAIELQYFSYRAFTSGADRLLEKRGLNRVHHRILYFVGRHPGRSVNQLLKTLRISKQALHVPLRQLVSMNLISSDRSAADARVKQLVLTVAGKRLEARLTGTQMLQLEAVLDAAGAEAEAGWRHVIALLAEDEV